MGAAVAAAVAVAAEVVVTADSPRKCGLQIQNMFGSEGCCRQLLSSFSDVPPGDVLAARLAVTWESRRTSGGATALAVSWRGFRNSPFANEMVSSALLVQACRGIHRDLEYHILG